MPVLSTGGMRYQHAWKDLPPDEITAESIANVRACVQASLACGIDHIETARGYGTSEYQLGLAFRELPRDRFVVQTKIGIGENLAQFEESFETSLSRLGLACVDLLSIHGINNTAELERALDYGVPRMLRWRDEGRIRFLGFSTHARTDVILRAVYTGCFDYINLHWYFVNQENWAAIQAAAHQDMGVFIISPNDKGGRLWDPPQKLRDFCRPLTPMQFNDLYCLSRDEVHTLSLGVRTPADYAEHIDGLKWYDERVAITETIARRIREEIDRHFVPGWHRSFAAGVPPPDRTPGGIHVREVLRLYTFAKAMDMVEFAKSRYNLFGNAGDWFPGNPPENFDEAEMYAALEHSPHRDRIIGYLHAARELLHGDKVQRQSVAAKEDDDDA